MQTVDLASKEQAAAVRALTAAQTAAEGDDRYQDISTVGRTIRNTALKFSACSLQVLQGIHTSACQANQIRSFTPRLRTAPSAGQKRHNIDADRRHADLAQRPACRRLS
jgi:hypothetical protein